MTMGFFDFFKKTGAGNSKAENPTSLADPLDFPLTGPITGPALSDARSSDTEIAKIAMCNLPGGPSPQEAVASFQVLRGTPEEACLVEEIARVSSMRRLPEPLLLALASTLVDRGEAQTASRVLVGTTSSPALVLAADLAERRGDLTTALSLVERVLLRDLDHPGARERHRRWQATLGFDVERHHVAPGATVVAREPDAPFDLLREVGRGGAGAVYEAVDRELGRHVALKVYHHPDRDKGQLAHEAIVAARLEGPGIVRVFDLDPGHGWLALEWAENGTLREHVRARSLEWLLPIERWAMPLAQALARIHGRGWVHHDVKPANVLVDSMGQSILTDFGIARPLGEPPPAGSMGDRKSVV